MREESIPFSKGELGVYSAKNGDKMVFERANGTFGGIGAVFFRRDTLKGYLVADEGVFEILGTFIVQDVQVDWMALNTKFFVDGFPGITNAGCLPVGKSNSVDRVGVLVVEDKDVVISTTGGDWKLTSLIRV